MLLGFSTGSSYKFLDLKNNDEANSIIYFFRLLRENIDFNCLEIILTEEIINTFFKISEQNFEWLKSLDYLSFHLINEKYNNEKVFKLFNNINYKIICHSDEYFLLSKNFRGKYTKNILLENIDYDKIEYGHDYDLCFDIAHAETIGKVRSYYNEYFDNIKEIHFSKHIKTKVVNSDKKIITEHHLPIVRFDKIEELKILKDCKIPVIIEGGCDSCLEMINEFYYIKKYIKGKK
jgi:hypothetical protein